uniref:Uncharacterized protein n=1 Tax=Leersia perrieri TaxID=77586 RepID=A0A0D9UWP3_9ORYZ
MAAALNIDGNNVDAVIDMGELGQAVAGDVGGGGGGGDAAAEELRLPRALGAVGFLTGGMAAAAAVYGSPPAGTLLARGGGMGYYLPLGGAFAAGVVEVWAALWISGDAAGRRGGVAAKLLCLAAVPFMIVVAVGGFAVHFKN